MNLGQLWDHFGCTDIFEAGPRPVHSLEDWNSMRRAYESVVGIDKSSIPRILKDEGENDSSSDSKIKDSSGFHVPVIAKQAGEYKGRGVFLADDATEPVQRGTLVWNTKFTARFDKGEDYRQFLSSIRADFACDVLQWAYVQAVMYDGDRTEKPFISVDLDEGSFINSVDGDYDDEPNVGCVENSLPGGCKENYFALRTIHPGDELVLDYSDFAISHGWRWFGL